MSLWATERRSPDRRLTSALVPRPVELGNGSEIPGTKAMLRDVTIQDHGIEKGELHGHLRRTLTRPRALTGLRAGELP